MPRPARAFTAESFDLEGRLLLASPPPSPVQFVVPSGLGTLIPSSIQVVTQQAGEATVTLSRPDTAGPLQLEVTTTGDPSGVVGAVDQAVTFAPGQSLATVSVPIIAGAPNSGEVDAYVVVKALNPTDSMAGTVLPEQLDLRIVASDPTLPPQVVYSYDTSKGIVLIFNKPMDPVGASNVNNYSMSLVYPKQTGGFFGIDTKTKFVETSVRFKSAQYDPATQTVSLITTHPLHDDFGYTLHWIRVKRAGRTVRTTHASKVAPGLTDLQGNPINADTTPGKVEYHVVAQPDSFSL